ncbi:MAG: TonB family protein, partial [Myxococcota bacterium]
VLSFTRRMQGELCRGGEVLTLAEVIARQLAEEEEEGVWVLPLLPGDVARVEVGGLSAEAFFHRAPVRASVDWMERIDYTGMNALLLVFFFAALFVISAVNRAEAAGGWGDDGERLGVVVKKLQVRLAQPAQGDSPAPRRRSTPLERRKPGRAHPGAVGRAGRENAPDQERRLANRGTRLLEGLFGGGVVNAVVSGNGLGTDLLEAVGRLTGNVVGDSAGTGGVGMGGTGVGGGGLDPVGIGSLPLPGRGSGYGRGEVPLRKEKGPRPSIDSGPVYSCGGGGEGCLDKELVRQVIRRNVGQIRYCYEAQLNQKPELSGKVAVRFVISAQGVVSQAEIAESSADHAGLEACVTSRVKSWRFPKPRANGQVVVTYPFLFRQAPLPVGEAG